MAEPYSDRLVIGDFSPGGVVVDLYTVPANERHVIRDIRLRTSAGGGLVQLDVVEPGTAEGKIVRRTFTGDETYVERDCRVTLRAGDRLRLYAIAGTAVTAYISGYRLDA